MDNGQIETTVESGGITLKEFGQLMLKHIILILVIAIGAAAITFLVTKLAVPARYTSEATFLIWYKSDSESSSSANNDLTYSKNLVSNCVEIMSQNSFYEGINEKLSEELSVKQIDGAITYNTKDNTSTIIASVETTSADLSYKIAIAIHDMTRDYVLSKYQSLDDNRAGINTINTVEKATEKSGPSYFLYTVVGGLIGLVVAVALVLIINKLDVRVKGETDLKLQYNIPIIGIIPEFDAAKKMSGSYYDYGSKRHKKGHAEKQVEKGEEN